MGDLMFDLIIIVILVLFAWRGASKGLILSLCGLLAVFVAFFAAQTVSDTFCVPVANILKPIISQKFWDVIPVSGTVAVDAEGAQPAVTADQVLAAVRANGLFEGFSDFLEQGAHSAVKNALVSPVEALADYLAKGIAKTLLFSLVFFGGLLAWFLLSHALDIAFKLPILAEVNLAGGLIIGLAKGVLVVVMLVWAGQLAGVVPSPPETPVLSLFTVDSLGRLLENLPA